MACPIDDILVDDSIGISIYDDNVAAIDFGTTFCSLAFKVKGNVRIQCLKINDTYDRVPNVILIKKDQHGGLNVADIGFVAQKKYKNIPPTRYNDYLYFECFKMQLRDEEKLSREMVISAFAGANYYIIEVIALILQHLRTRFEKHLAMLPHQIRVGSTLRKLKATDFHWVLTVPEIWKDRGKQMMREAAYRSGLLCDVPPIERLTAPPTQLSEPNIPYAAKEKLVLALEPECAALYCQQLTTDMMATYCDQSTTLNSKQYMILDIGGGTVDIAIHDLVANKIINSVLPPTGNEWGGTKVNHEFSVLLQKITGDKEFRNFYTTQNKEALHKAIITNLVFQDFEQPKKQFGESLLDDDTVFIRVDPRLVKFYGQFKLGDSSKKYGVEFDDDTISIAFSKMKELFQPAIDGIVSCMMLALDKSPVAIDTIYLVGGFGGCPYVYTKVKETLGRRNLSVIVPVDHKVVVAQGAVIFRQKMSIVNSRVSDAYYGVRITEKFDERKHPLERRVYNNTHKCYEVKNYFSPFVCKGQSVKFGEKFERTFYPSISQTNITLPIYRTTKDGVMFVKDLHGNPIPGIEELGELNLPAPRNDLSISQRKVKVELILGGTELQVRAVYESTGLEINATLDFLKQVNTPDDTLVDDDNIAAIDFGTTFCSLAFKVKGNVRIQCLKINDTFDRVPNAILIKKDQHGGLNVADIGFVAQKKYKNIPPAKYKDYLYFECFKMQLRDEEKLSREMVISTLVGANYYIIEVIALILQHLRVRFEKHLSVLPHQIRDGSTSRKLKATDFHWVLTVPAIWKDRGKQMMREAAYRAGLLCDVPPIERFIIPPTRLSEPNIPYAAKEKLVLALEPECAALYCQQLTNDMMAAYCDRSTTVSSKRYMVLDIGGGTVDIAIYDSIADKTINSVLPPTGNDWGGTKVNNEFSVLLQKMTGDKEFRNFYTIQNKEALHKAIITNLVFQDFEQPKKQFGESSLEEIDDDAVFIRVDPRLVKFYGQKLEESSNKYGVEFDDDTISIAFSKMKELFQPAIDGIVSCMMSAMQRSPGAIDTIYLVGGFGGCPYVYTKVKETLGRRNIRVIVPTNHEVAVVQGAVIFRQEQLFKEKAITQETKLSHNDSIITDSSLPNKETKSSIIISTSNTLSDGKLNETHLSILVDELSDLGPEWEIVAIHLGIKIGVINEIKHNNNNNLSLCRKDMIIKWLDSDAARKCDLSAALRKVDKVSLANKIDTL